jgi:hypothetical protein
MYQLLMGCILSLAIMGNVGSCSTAPESVVYDDGAVQEASIGAVADTPFTSVLFAPYFDLENMRYTGEFSLGADGVSHGCSLVVPFESDYNAAFGVSGCTTAFAGDQTQYPDVVRYEYEPLTESGYEDLMGGCSASGPSGGISNCTFISSPYTIGDVELYTTLGATTAYNGGAARSITFKINTNGNSVDDLGVYITWLGNAEWVSPVTVTSPVCSTAFPPPVLFSDTELFVPLVCSGLNGSNITVLTVTSGFVPTSSTGTAKVIGEGGFDFDNGLSATVKRHTVTIN